MDSITILKYQLYFVSLNKEIFQTHIPKYLLSLLLNPLEDSFFSYTESNDEEISLVIDKASLGLIPSDGISVSPGVWRAIQIYEGPDALNAVGYVRKYSEPLGKAGIFLIYLSTYNTDLIIVKEENIDRAYNILSEHFKNQDELVVLEDNLLSTSPNFMMERESTHKAYGKILTVSPLPNHLKVVYIQRKHIENHTLPILNILMSAGQEDRFCTITFYGEEGYSFVLSEKDINLFNKNLKDYYIIHDNTWQTISIEYGSKGFTIGIVNIVSNILAHHNIPIYYQSTVNDDFIMVPAHLIDNAIKKLESK
jgi:hypothetical protein